MNNLKAIPIGYKKCNVCDKVKSLNNFYKHKGTSDGRIGKCVTCSKENTGTVFYINTYWPVPAIQGK